MIEAVVAIGIVSIGTLSIIGLLGQSNTSSQESREREEAVKGLGFVKAKLREMPFEDAYELIKGTEPPYYYYQYSANPDAPRSDATPEPGRERGSRLQKGFRRSDDPFFVDDLEYREGAVFKLRISELVPGTTSTGAFPPSDKLKAPGFSLALEFFVDPLPGQNEEDWIAANRVLRVPLLVAR